MATKNQKLNTHQYLDGFDDFLESFERLEHESEKVTHAVADTAKEVTQATVGELKNDFSKAMLQVFGDFYGSTSKDQHHTEKAHDESDHKEKKSAHRVEGGYDYVGEIIHGSERASRENTQELQQKIHEILAEIKKLAASSKELQNQFKEIAVEDAPVKPGTYHESFFEWMLTTIRTIRMRVEDSGAWLSAMRSKKGKKDYWSMFKKHGTQFGMSGERSVSNQIA